MNQPKLIWGCKGKEIELNSTFFTSKKSELIGLSALFFNKMEINARF
jgi:hypothetical protein